MLYTENNMRIVGHNIGAHIKGTNAWPSLGELTERIKKSSGSNEMGKLEFGAVAVDPANPRNFPYADDPQLAWLTSVDSYEQAPAEKIRRFMQPAAVDSGLYIRFNDRVEHLRLHKIRAPKVEKPAEPVKSKAQTMLDYFHARVEAIGPDYRPAIRNIKNRLRNEIQTRVRERNSLEEIGQFVDREIQDFTNGSIR
jgi:hypothetical protein